MRIHTNHLTCTILVLLIACTQSTITPHGASPETVAKHTITTIDGERIAYTPYLAQPNDPAVILLHMLNHTRITWDEYARMLQEEGFNVIAIDLRGHGQSSGTFDSFDATGFNNMVNDVRAAKDVLTAKGADTTRLSLIGASIGANIALNYAGDDPDVNTVVLLSPGKNYRGVDITHYSYEGPIMWVASTEDAASIEAVDALSKPEHYTAILANAGHGTQMLPRIRDQITSWIIQQR